MLAGKESGQPTFLDAILLGAVVAVRARDPLDALVKVMLRPVALLGLLALCGRQSSAQPGPNVCHSPW